MKNIWTIKTTNSIGWGRGWGLLPLHGAAARTSDDYQVIAPKRFYKQDVLTFFPDLSPTIMYVWPNPGCGNVIQNRWGDCYRAPWGARKKITPFLTLLDGLLPFWEWFKRQNTLEITKKLPKSLNFLKSRLFLSKPLKSGLFEIDPPTPRGGGPLD